MVKVMLREGGLMLQSHKAGVYSVWIWDLDVQEKHAASLKSVSGAAEASSRAAHASPQPSAPLPRRGRMMNEA